MVGSHNMGFCQAACEVCSLIGRMSNWEKTHSDLFSIENDKSAAQNGQPENHNDSNILLKGN